MRTIVRRLLTYRNTRKLPIYKEPEEREGLRAAGRFNAQVMDFIRPQVVEGVTTAEIDRLADAYIRDHGHLPACHGYRGFPKSICTSVNEVVCHGIPSDYRLKSGDIVNVDITSIVNGWYGDSSETFLIGNVSDDAVRITQLAFDAMWIGIRSIQPYSPVIDIGLAIARFGVLNKLGVVEAFQGHGIGREFHQEPGIPHIPIKKSKHALLMPGVSFTIEPMLNLGSRHVDGPHSDGWTVVTQDRSLSAQFEHQILMTEDGPEILTLTEHGPQEGHRFTPPVT